MCGPYVWRKSSYSTGDGSCVEVAWELPVVWVRDSKDVAKQPLRISAQGWERFREAICIDDTFRPY
ncbi:DUF397 domain-containing protein [Streptomyces sp. NPDC006465]|uniref:DUF397 domain-containing protein n=1 Tax=Streptomyces sp. NPDC006465 TaxID=3157174 RepID=UPI0033B55790